MRTGPGRPSDRDRHAQRRAFIASIAHDAPSLTAAMDESGIRPHDLVKLLDEVGVTPQAVLALLVADEATAA